MNHSELPIMKFVIERDYILLRDSFNYVWKINLIDTVPRDAPIRIELLEILNDPINPLERFLK